MRQKYLIFFRSDGYSEIGLGHLIRSLSIADAINSNYTVDIKFIIRPKSAVTLKQISNSMEFIEINNKEEENESLCVADIVGGEKGDILITDSYQHSIQYYKILRKQMPTVPVIAIDDFGEKADYPVAGIINCGIASYKEYYPANLLKNSAIGPEYFPIRRDLIQKGFPVRKNKKKVKRVLVTMGGSDPQEQTIRIARLLKRVKCFNVIDLLLGPAYGPCLNLEEQIKDDNRFLIHQNPSNIAELMSLADFAITGGGVTCNELLYLGVPVAVMALSDDQEPFVRAVERYRCGILLGRFDLISDQELFDVIKRISSDSFSFQAMADKGKELIDGKGGNRIAEYINDFLDDYHRDKFSISEIIEEYESLSGETEEYKRLKWGSHEGMTNRFHLAIETIKWQEVHSWLDIGSGTGSFLKEAEREHTFELFRGIDLSHSLTNYAESRKYKTKNTNFGCQNFLDPVKEGPFDLVTLIGVLHKCGIPLQKAMNQLAELVKEGGQLFLTTKNRGWKKFNEPNFIPYEGHHWFTVSELNEAISLASFRIVKLEGFEPRIPGKICKPAESHSLFILARRDE